MRISPIQTGIPIKTGTDLMIRPIIINTEATTCSVYYEVTSDIDGLLANGNIELSEAEYTAWGQDNTYVDELVLTRLNLTRNI